MATHKNGYKLDLTDLQWLAVSNLLTQCCLEYNTGLTHSRISPFKQLRRLIPSIPNGKKAAIKYMETLYRENGRMVNRYCDITIQAINQNTTVFSS